MSKMRAILEVEANASGLEKGLKTAQNALNATSKGVDSLNKQFKAADSAAKTLGGFNKTKNNLVALQKGIGTTKTKLKEFQTVLKNSGSLDATATSQMEHYTRLLKTQERQHKVLGNSMRHYKASLKSQGLYTKDVARNEEKLTSVLKSQIEVRTRLDSKIKWGKKWETISSALPLTTLLGGNPMMGGAGMVASTLFGGGAGLATMGALGLAGGAVGMFNGAEGQAYRSKDTALRLMQNTGGFSDSMRGTISDTLLRTSSMSLMQEPQLIDALQVLIANGVQTQTALAMLPTLAKASKGSGTDPLDMAELATALSLHMGVKPQDIGKALDVLSTAGKLGSFELNNMAQFMPKLGAMFKVMNLDQKNLPAVGAMLQVAKKGAGTPEEAANNLFNFLSKAYSTETLNKFSKKGVDVVDLIANPKKYFPKAESGLEAFMMKIREMTKNGTDLKVMSALFGDQQVKNFLIPMMSNWQEYERIKEKSSKDSAGAIDRDFKNISQSSEASTQRLGSSWHKFSTQVLVALNPIGSKLADLTAGALDLMTNVIKAGTRPATEKEKKGIQTFVKSYTPKSTKTGDAFWDESTPYYNPNVVPPAKRQSPAKKASAGGGTVVVQVASLPSRQQLTAFMDMAKNATQGTMSDMPEYA
jgi:TP901 family phage tail tape measure protein